jgi:hypothetical protein
MIFPERPALTSEKTSVMTDEPMSMLPAVTAVSVSAPVENSVTVPMSTPLRWK